MRYFRENVDTETMHRTRADVQNLILEREMDEIRLRQLNEERDELRSELGRLEALRDAHGVVAAEQARELSESAMTLDMYRAHNESLSMHLKGLGGESGMIQNMTCDLKHSLRGLFRSRGKIKDEPQSKKGPEERQTKGECTSEADDDHDDDDDIEKAMRRSLSPEDDDDDDRPNLIGGLSKSRHSSKDYTPVGGIAVTTSHGSRGGESSAFLRKLPTIFKLGGGGSRGNNNNNNNDGDDEGKENNGDGGDYPKNNRSRENREVEFMSDSNSVSAISVLTFDEEDCFSGSDRT